jgi:hypothetical protein
MKGRLAHAPVPDVPDALLQALPMERQSESATKRKDWDR